MKAKSVVKKLSEIRETFFVRTGLNPDRVKMFVDLYESGAKVPRIRITEDGQLIEGRHRKAALEQLGRTETECEVSQNKHRRELLIEALEANLGGSMPPSPADIMYTIKQLITGGMSQIEVIRKLNSVAGFPVSMCKRYVENVRLRLNNEKTIAALAAIADRGISVKAAAEEFGVGLDVVKNAIKGKKKKVDEMDFRELKSGLSSQFRSTAGKTGATMRKLFEAYHDGLVGIDLVEKVVKEMGRLVKKLDHSVKDWQKRLDAHKPKLATSSKKEAKPVQAASKKK